MPPIASSIRDLRRRWKPHKERLSAQEDGHPNPIRFHRACSWLARVEQMPDAADQDLALMSQWIAFNSLYGQWNAPIAGAKVSRRRQFAVALGEDRRVTSGQLVSRRHVADRAVQPLFVVLLDEPPDKLSRFAKRQGRVRSNAIALERLMPAFDLAVALRVVRRRLHVGHPRDANELLKIFGDELRPVVGDDSRRRVGKRFLGALERDLDVRLGQPTASGTGRTSQVP